MLLVVGERHRPILLLVGEMPGVSGVVGADAVRRGCEGCPAVAKSLHLQLGTGRRLFRVTDDQPLVGIYRVVCTHNQGWGEGVSWCRYDNTGEAGSRAV